MSQATTLLGVFRENKAKEKGAFSFDNLFDADRYPVGGRVVETLETITRKAEEEKPVKNVRRITIIAGVDFSKSLTALEELSLEAQTVDRELEEYAEARENEGFKWGER
jgi:hypothetical protein